MAQAALRGRPAPGIVQAAALSERWGLDAAHTPLLELATAAAALRIWRLVAAHRAVLRSGAPRIALRRLLNQGRITPTDYDALDALLREGMVTGARR